MANLRAQVLAVLACGAAILFCCVVLVGSAHADSIPPDPIIDMEGVSGGTGLASPQLAAPTINPNFMATFTFPTTNCSSDGVMHCNTPTPLTFVNNGPAIADMDFVINTFNSAGVEVDINQGGFMAPSPTTNPRAYQVVYQNPNGIEAIYAAPTGFEIATGQSFFANFQDVLIPNGGSAVVHMEANVPVPTPEPAGVALVGVSIPAVVWLRRKKR